MRQIYKIIAIVLIILFIASPVKAEEQEFFSDPLFEPLFEGGEHPLQDLINLALKDDARAQFILGDLYSKGKGGFKKNIERAQSFFERSAKLGYKHSFIRLAALAKKEEDFITAYKWYNLAIDYFPHGDLRLYIVRAMNKMSRDQKMNKKDIRMAKRGSKDWHITRLDKIVLKLDEVELVKEKEDKRTEVTEVIKKTETMKEKKEEKHEQN